MKLFTILFLILNTSAFAQNDVKLLSVTLEGVSNDPNDLELSILKRVYQCIGKKFTMTRVPYGRHLKYFNKGDFDGVTTVPPSAKLDGYSSQSHISYINGVSTLESKKHSIQSVRDLYGLRVISFVGAMELLPSIKNHYKKFKSYSELSGQESHSKMLFKGRVDAVISDVFIFQSYNQKIRKENPSEIAFKQKTKFHHIFDTSDFTMYFKNKVLKTEFDTCLNKLKANKTIERIKYQYMINKLIDS